MIEVKWQSSTATNITKIIPRLPIFVNEPRPTFAVCQNLIPLNQNIELLFDGFDETLTFRWEQISGSLVDITDPNSFNATVDLIGQPPDDRFFRLIVNEGRLNETEVIVPVFSRIVSTSAPGLSSSNSKNITIGAYDGKETEEVVIFTPRNTNFGACSVTGTEYLYVTLVEDLSTIEYVGLQIWDPNTRQWLDEQIGNPDFPTHRFLVIEGFSYRVKVLWKRSPFSTTIYEYNSDVLRYTGRFEGFPAVTSKDTILDIASLREAYSWDIDRIRRNRIILDDPEQTEKPVGGFDLTSVINFNIFNFDRITRTQIILDDPEQTEKPVGGFDLSAADAFQTFDIERVSGINISV